MKKTLRNVSVFIFFLIIIIPVIVALLKRAP